MRKLFHNITNLATMLDTLLKKVKKVKRLTKEIVDLWTNRFLLFLMFICLRLVKLCKKHVIRSQDLTFGILPGVFFSSRRQF